MRRLYNSSPFDIFSSRFSQNGSSASTSCDAWINGKKTKLKPEELSIDNPAARIGLILPGACGLERTLRSTTSSKQGDENPLPLNSSVTRRSQVTGPLKMLITLCYSVLTWMQSRQRSEIVKWIEECLINETSCSLVFIRGDSPSQCQGPPPPPERPASASSFYYSALPSDSQYSSAWSVDTISRCSSAFSTPRRELSTPSTPITLLKKSLSFDSTGDSALISSLCFNHTAIKLMRLLWQEENSRALAIIPKQIVELHDWTAFKTPIRRSPVPLEDETRDKKDTKTFKILFEAEPGQVQKSNYRKFATFGEVVAWRWSGELGLILQSDLAQLIELMHIFRLGQIVLEGGWRVFRLTTIGTEGAVGTLIARPDLCSDKALTPFDLRRLSAGNHTNSQSLIYRPFSVVTPTCLTTGIFERVANHTANNSRHDITTISEEAASTTNDENGDKRLLNWYERSPRKSVATIPTFEKATHTPRRKSFSPGSLLSSAGGKSSSLVSLVLCKQALSVEEQEEEDVIPQLRAIQKGIVPSSKSHESLSTLTKGGGSETSTPKLLSPTSAGISLSVTSSPHKMHKKSPQKRVGKPPNILILCDDTKKREQISEILKKMLANDRYAIYDIRWDQLDVGGWAEQAALLIVAGNIPPGTHSSRLLQFLGDGGRLLAWCCNSPPFGPSLKNDASTSNVTKSILEYGGPSCQKISQPLNVSTNLWTTFQKIVETSDSEGYSRPLTASVWAKRKGTGETVVLQLDGGALGGKAIFSQIEFEKCSGVEDDEDALTLLSLLLSQNLEIDCSQIKAPEYTIGYLLGDHMKIQDFLSSVPSSLQQGDLTVEFTPHGSKGSTPNHLRFPIHSLECPTNFSTLDYFENLDSKELGRLVIYTDIITSTMKVVTGQSLAHGITVIARRQTSGRGRGKNVWLSPEGCAVFTVQLVVNMESHMGRRLSLLQHIAALSVILAVPNHKEINLRVKWPNDIYAGEQKIGGVLVESRLEGKEAVVNVGVGFNVSNAYPTVCLNSLLFNDFQSPPTSLPNAGTNSKNTPTPKPSQDRAAWNKKGYWSTEKLIARTLTEMEKLVESMDKPLGLDDVLEQYQDNWVHHTSLDDELSLVNVEVSEGVYAECRISGIDEYGFLRVVDTSSGNMFSVRPDGNSFDIANRLIAIKD